MPDRIAVEREFVNDAVGISDVAAYLTAVGCSKTTGAVHPIFANNDI